MQLKEGGTRNQQKWEIFFFSNSSSTFKFLAVHESQCTRHKCDQIFLNKDKKAWEGLFQSRHFDLCDRKKHKCNQHSSVPVSCECVHSFIFIFYDHMSQCHLWKRQMKKNTWTDVKTFWHLNIQKQRVGDERHECWVPPETEK